MEATTGTWLMVGGAGAMFVSYALGWSTHGGARGDSPLHYPLTGGIAWLLVIAVGIVALLRSIGHLDDDRVGVGLVVASAVAVVLLAVRFVLGGRTVSGVDVDLGPGAWIALLASAASVTGAVSAARR